MSVPIKEKRSPFLWGAATSSYQVEGGITNNDWHYFTNEGRIKKRINNLTKPSIFYRGINHSVKLQGPGDACKAWDPDYYLQDFNLAKNLGMNALKISLEWSRIEPERGEWNFDALSRYADMIESMHERGLTPIVTLYHLTLPKWVLTPPIEFKKRLYQYFLPNPFRHLPIGDPDPGDPYWKSLRGWEDYRTVEAFIEYVKTTVSYLRDKVDYWITISEPVASVIGGGYLAGIYPPGFFLDGNRAKMALHNLIEAHIQAYDVISSLDNVDSDYDGEPKKVGMAHLMVAVSPVIKPKLFSSRRKWNKAAADNFSYFVNDYFLNAIINGEEDLNYLKTLCKSDRESDSFIVHENWKNKVDFVGLNYYRRVHVCRNRMVSSSSARFVGGIFSNSMDKKENPTDSPLNDLGWEIYPEGLYYLIMHINDKWNKPVLVTENGVADKSDRLRAPFIVSHLQQLKRAMDNNAEVLGYIHWSFMDNYEWHEGYNPDAKFGLFSIDLGDNAKEKNLKRRGTNGADALELIIKESFSHKSGGITHQALSKAQEVFGMIKQDQGGK